MELGNTRRANMSADRDPLEAVLLQTIADHLEQIEKGPYEEDRFEEASFRDPSLGRLVIKFLHRHSVELADFADTCGMRVGQLRDFLEGDANYGTLAGVRRGIEIVASADRARARKDPPRKVGTEEPPDPPRTTDADHAFKAAVHVLRRPEKWVYTDLEEVAGAISAVSVQLEKLLRTIKQSNEVGGKDSAIGPVQKKMLLAMIEGMLIELTQPYIERERVSGFFKSIWDVTKKGLEKGASDEIAKGVGGLVDAGRDLAKKMMTSPGVESLSDIPPGIIDA